MHFPTERIKNNGTIDGSILMTVIRFSVLTLLLNQYVIESICADTNHDLVFALV